MAKSTYKARVLEFINLFEKEIKPILRNYEVYRQKEFRKFIIYICLISIFCLLGLFVVLMLFVPNFQISFDSINIYVFFMIASLIMPSASIFLPIFFTFHMRKKSKQFGLTLKSDCLKRVLIIFGNIEWKCSINKDDLNGSDAWMSNSELDESGLFIPFNTRKVDDEFKGEWQDVKFVISETEMLDIHGSGKNRTCIEAFKGIIIKFKFNKNIKNRTIVATKGDLTRKSTVWTSVLLGLGSCVGLFRDGFSWLSLFLTVIIVLVYLFIAKQTVSKEEPLDEVILEDSRFNKRFNVYSSDQVEARYLVTPSFMERLYNLQTTFGAKKIKCAFFDDNLMIAIHTKKDLFELGDLFHNLLETNSHNEFFKDLNSILSMVEYFKLDKNIRL